MSTSVLLRRPKRWSGRHEPFRAREARAEVLVFASSAASVFGIVKARVSVPVSARNCSGLVQHTR